MNKRITFLLFILLFLIILVPSRSFSADTPPPSDYNPQTDKPIGGIIMHVFPPSLLTFPYCPFQSIIVVGSHPGWFAVIPIITKKFPLGEATFIHLHQFVIGGVSKKPCGLVPGYFKLLGTTP